MNIHTFCEELKKNIRHIKLHLVCEMIVPIVNFKNTCLFSPNLNKIKRQLYISLKFFNYSKVKSILFILIH